MSTAASRNKFIASVEAVAERRLLRPDPDLDNALANSRKKNLPNISISPMQGQHLSVLCQLNGAKSVLEIGTLGGYSTIWFVKAGARVTSIEVRPKHRDVALENLHSAGLDAEIILGAALDVLPKLGAEKRQFDLVFIDADWGDQWEYFDWAVKLTRKGGCIYIDNVVQEMIYGGASAAENSLVARLGKDDRVTASLTPTISAHKAPGGDAFIDGFVLATVL
ncbi:putative O-methyltransferase [Tolypocladium ophioglossoides CBS 100239]|uniref:Putative O-methyltransferase n=1 Tax=Tolypocladium ophioglossoides (strain CBS 100239) TaxID=1163406 RepID=A0A0L0MXW5_TOLOC|nr:putative O-methyltransferase [Tolypocladium ophioglossoides CBS 100239]